MKKLLQSLDLSFFIRLSLTGIALLALLEASLVAMVGEFFIEGIWPGLFLFWFALSFVIYCALKYILAREKSGH
jgi:hypothetical protein